MKMTLPRLGLEEVEIDPNTLIEFPNGLPGLEGCKNFKLFHSEESPVIFWLQSIDDTDVVLSLTDPDALQIFYDLSLTDEEMSALQVAAGDELQIAVVLSQHDQDSIAQSAVLANFKSPIIINVSKRTALQKSLHNSELPIRTYQSLPADQQSHAAPISCFGEVPPMRSFAGDNFSSVAF